LTDAIFPAIMPIETTPSQANGGDVVSIHHSLCLGVTLMFALVLPPGQLAAAEGKQRRADLDGDPLPAEALARLGTTRWRVNREVYSLAVSPDGKTLAVGANWEIGLWDLGTGKRRHQFHKSCCYNWSVAFSPDGKTLFSAGQDDEIHLWDSATGAQKRLIKGHKGVIPTLALSADGKVLASRSADETLRVWDVASGKEQHRVDVCQTRATATRWSFPPTARSWPGSSPARSGCGCGKWAAASRRLCLWSIRLRG
jgi:WD40 repeat protein